MRGYDNLFVIKMGSAPHSESSSATGVYKGEKHPLVYDSSNRCVGVVFEHCEARVSTANRQAEICFFDDFFKEYDKWRRMFDVGHGGRERIIYALVDVAPYLLLRPRLKNRCFLKVFPAIISYVVVDRSNMR